VLLKKPGEAVIDLGVPLGTLAGRLIGNMAFFIKLAYASR
jgi:hypothetical protein